MGTPRRPAAVRGVSERGNEQIKDEGARTNVRRSEIPAAPDRKPDPGPDPVERQRRGNRVDRILRREFHSDHSRERAEPVSVQARYQVSLRGAGRVTTAPQPKRPRSVQRVRQSKQKIIPQKSACLL